MGPERLKWHVNALGRAMGAVSPRGTPLTLDVYSQRASLGLALIEPPVSGITTATGASCTVNSSAAVSIGGETLWQVTGTASASSNNWFEITLPVASEEFSAGDLTLEFYTTDLSKFTQITPYVGNSAYSVYASSAVVNQLTPGVNTPWAINGLTAYQIRENSWTKSGFTDAIGNNAFVNCKIRCFVTNGQTGVIALRSVRVSAARRKARIAITADDGYSSFHRFGVPILNEFGFKSTASIIYEHVGDSGYATLPMLQAYVAAGNECIAHGPNHPSTGGVGNLFTAWSTNAERIADVVACRDYLLANRLTTEYGARSYVWPQGQYAASASDLSLLALMQANGFTVGRAASIPTTHYTHKANSLSQSNLAALTLPVIGHVFTNSGAEEANINSIKARIVSAAIAGVDCTLMLHHVVGVDAASAALDISSNRLRQLCEGIRSEVDAGMMDVVLYSEFAK